MSVEKTPAPAVAAEYGDVVQEQPAKVTSEGIKMAEENGQTKITVSKICPYPKSIGVIPYDWQHDNDASFSVREKGCFPYACFILTGIKPVIDEADLGDHRKSLEALRNANFDVKYLCRSCLHDVYLSEFGFDVNICTMSLDDEKFFEQVDLFPCILVHEALDQKGNQKKEDGKPILHALACAGNLKANPHQGQVHVYPTRTYFNSLPKPCRLLAAFVFYNVTIDQCQKRIRDNFVPN
jgi:hypothetical protein